jgi:hypothetical protein
MRQRGDRRRKTTGETYNREEILGQKKDKGRGKQLGEKTK